jgi:phospholipase C
MGKQLMPRQELGTAPARALPYQPWANATRTNGAVVVQLGNAGSAAVQLQVYDRLSVTAAQRVDVPAHGSRSASVPAAIGYDIAVHGPNGFLREIVGTAADDGIDVAAEIAGSSSHPMLELKLSNRTRNAVELEISGLGRSSKQVTVRPGTRTLSVDPIGTAHGWYDIRVRIEGHEQYLRRFTGHLENGRASVTG